MRALGTALVVVGAVTAAAACDRPAEESRGERLQLDLDPDPPVVGPADLTLTLHEASGAPLTGAEVRVEGTMNHAGMVPVFATLEEAEPGRYTGTLDFTMRGDWVLIVDAKAADGHRVRRQLATRVSASP